MISMILLVLAFVCFLLASVNVGHPKVNLVAVGLASWSLSVLLGGVHLH